MVVTDFFFERVDTSKITSGLAFFLTLPPGNRFSISSASLSLSDRLAASPSTPLSLAATHLPASQHLRDSLSSRKSYVTPSFVEALEPVVQPRLV